MKGFGMDWKYGSAMDGNIALTGEIDMAAHPEFTCWRWASGRRRTRR